MFRNREIQHFTTLFLAINGAAALMGLAISPAAAVLVLILAAACGICFFCFTRTRYRRIEEMSDQIDQILHHGGHLSIQAHQEGELSILQTEIGKMTLRIREQNDNLKKEKEHLAHSLADIAHQLRTPLTSVHLILSLLENSPSGQEHQNLLREMEDLLVRMDWLLTSLLKLSRLDAGIIVFQRQTIDVSRLLNDSLRPLLISMDLHNIRLDTDIPEGASLEGDFDWLSEALQNILKNCMESAGDNGTITVVCQDTPIFTEIRIHDSGKGFSKEDLPRLFDRFYRGKSTQTAGYGIGLSLCKTIVTRHGGTVTAKNHPQGGAVFCLRFPKTFLERA